MTGVKILIVEDEPIIAADLKMQLEKADMEVMATLEDGPGVLDYLKDASPDLIIMDIQLYGDLDGVDVANQVNRLYDIPIVFLTSNTDLTTFKRAKLTYPHAFLSKPFRIKDVLHAIELALDNHEDDADKKLEFLADRIFIRNSDGLEKVMYERIMYIEADGAYTKIVTDEKAYTLSQTLKKTEANITADYLMRVHRSYIVNVRNVEKISDGHLYLHNSRIPVSRGYRSKLEGLFRTL